MPYGGGYGGYGGMMRWGGFGYGMGLIGWLFMLVFWILLIVGLVLVIRWLWEQGRRSPGGQLAEPPLDILKRRYARGEISKEEFDRMRQDLS